MSRPRRRQRDLAGQLAVATPRDDTTAIPRSVRTRMRARRRGDFGADARRSARPRTSDAALQLRGDMHGAALAAHAASAPSTD